MPVRFITAPSLNIKSDVDVGLWRWQASWVRRILLVILYAYFLLSIPMYTCIGFALALVTLPFDPQRRLLHLYMSLWAEHYVHLNPYWQLYVRGREHIKPHQTYILCANHLSAIDTLVLFGLRRHFKWIAKREAFWTPFLGWMMWLARYIDIRRRDPQSIAQMLERCRKELNHGSSILIFPEGTRSRDGRLRPFKHGAFTLAVESNVPIIPIVIHGTFAALPKSRFWIDHRNQSRIQVDVLPAVDPHEFNGDPHSLRTFVRTRILEHYAFLSGLAPADVDGER